MEKPCTVNNAIYRKTMENLRNRINVKLVNNDQDYWKCTWKPSYMLHKMFDNNLVAIWKSKVALKLLSSKKFFLYLR